MQCIICWLSKPGRKAATLIEGLALRELERTGEDTRLIRWLQQLPEAVVQQHKTLLLVYVKLADVALSRAEVARFLSQVEANVTRKPPDQQTDDEREVLAEIQRVRRLWASEDGEPDVRARQRPCCCMANAEPTGPASGLCAAGRIWITPVR